MTRRLDGAHLGSGVWDAGQRDGGGSEDGFAVGRIARWAEGARKGVRRIGRGFMPGEEGFCTGSGEGKESLEAILIAAEEPFCFQGFEIELIEEGAITVRRGADPGEEDGIGVLADDQRAVSELAINRIAGVLVMLILG